METLLARRELTLLIAEGNVLKIVVQEPDKYSGLHAVLFISNVFDTYTSKWLEPRTHTLFLSPAQVHQLGEFLLAA